ncbi:MAG: four-helix bundle copper-binding protein [Massilia sp.]
MVVALAIKPRSVSAITDALRLRGTSVPASPIATTDLKKVGAATCRPGCAGTNTGILGETFFFHNEENIMQQQQYQSGIEACNDCADACDMCATACLQEQDVKAMARCIALDIDCAQLCRLGAGAMARGSEAAGIICQACAELCDICGDECSKHPMQHCQDCATACRRCAAECRQMSGAGTGRGSGTGAAAH